MGQTRTTCGKNGDLILTRGRGKKLQQLKVKASDLSIVEERNRTDVPPFRYELQATLLGVAKTSGKGKKRSDGKRIR